MSDATQVLGAMVMLSRATLLLTVTNDGMEGNGRTVTTARLTRVEVRGARSECGGQVNAASMSPALKAVVD